ncbi:uncharacterized protein LOC130442810 isoform X2 [Diorhabda sublineata]|uniref:uncharacterized protein LOC130442810 isoform X2 n=1 Tax=Diorhabda sublineata TaxID=1163346 RepID=UPI0024E044DD|nr:uncharacterized protein LOC130442810 isoform X2 [Diorhabda sublineata]
MRILILIMICACATAKPGFLGDVINKITGHVVRTLGIENEESIVGSSENEQPLVVDSENDKPIISGTGAQEESPSLPFRFFKGIFNALDNIVVPDILDSENKNLNYGQGDDYNQLSVIHNYRRIPRRIYRYYANMGVKPLPNSEMCSCPFELQFRRGSNNYGTSNNRNNSFMGTLDEVDSPFVKPSGLGKDYPSDNPNNFSEEPFQIPNYSDVLKRPPYTEEFSEFQPRPILSTSQQMSKKTDVEEILP